ncbi:DUF6950 family protein [Thalassospira marina]|uniref:DUF6950 domain-containing protein n=1 Tax=Thalassospira marina TaxID=2048283 RepID=A0A2N3KV39_9PROT|nr:hypothetical protein COO20_09720 [Thalassospira marina]
MMRKPHWEKHLAEWHRVAETRPFLWGKHDCCLTACDAVLAITGIDPAKDLRGLCDDRRGAIRVMRDYAGGGVEKTVAKAFAACGFGYVPVLFARRGDCGLVSTDDGPALAVCMGATWVAQGKNGLVQKPLKEGLRAWRV